MPSTPITFEWFIVRPLADRETFELTLCCGHVLHLTLAQCMHLAEEVRDLEQETRGICPRSGEPY